tara:strand:+ start:6226 stop:6423 length:198 start_codon:yes stop_codon:yes gene_type:complete
MIFLAVIPFLFIGSNLEFFEQASEEIEGGAKWHYVGRTPVDPKAKSLAIEDLETGEKHILWKLKK